MAFLDQDQIASLGFQSVGSNVLISSRAVFYGANRITLGSNIRIDDFCVVSAGVGGVSFGDYIHMAIYSSIIGAGRVIIKDYANISSRVSIYSSSDDFSGGSMTNPLIPEKYKNVTVGSVYIGRHVIVGSGSVILPNVIINDGAAIGALSLVKTNCQSYAVYAGNPAKKLKDRKRDLIKKEDAFRLELAQIRNFQ